jgi:hypothetical protein
MRCSNAGWCERLDPPVEQVDAGGEVSDACDVSLEATPRYIDITDTIVGGDTPYLSQGHVFYDSRVDDEAGGGSREVFQINAETHEKTRLTVSSDDEILHGAAGGKLFLEIHGLDPEPRWSIYDLATAAKQDHLSGDARLFRSEYGGAPMQTFDAARLLLSDGDGGLELMRVDEWTAGLGADLAGLDLAGQPTLTPYGFAYAASASEGDSDNSLIYLSSLDQGVPGSLGESDETNRHPYADDNDLYWVSDQAVYVAEGSQSPERIHQGQCGPPHASGGRAVFVCSSPNSFWPDGRGQSVYVYDGESTRQIAAFADETFAYAARIGEHGVVWFEYDDAGVFSGSSSAGTGRLMYYDLEYDASFEIDQVGAPCMSCGRHSPPVVLRIEGDVVAWNYAGSALGYATLERSRECAE